MNLKKFDIYLFKFLIKKMDEFQNCWRVWKTSLELLKDRNYLYNSTYDKVTISEFRYILQNNLFEIISEDQNRMIYLKFIRNSKIKGSNIKDIVEEVKKKAGDRILEIILILWIKPNSTLIKLEKEVNGLQIFWYKNMLFNPTKHILVPKHVKLSENEVSELKKQFSITNNSQLPNILKDDPIVRYYNFKVGDILKIDKVNGSMNYNYCNYRYVR